MENIIKNKWFKLIKYLMAGLLILSAIIALASSWYADRKINISALFDGKPYGVDSLRIASLVFGFLGIFVAIYSLSNSTKPVPTIIGLILAFSFTVLLLVLGGLIMTQLDYELIAKK